MKKIFICILALSLLCLVFAACKDNENPPDTELSDEVTVTAPIESDEVSESQSEVIPDNTEQTKSPWENGVFSADTNYANGNGWTPDN